MKNNEFLVRVKRYENDKEHILAAFYTDNLSEYIKIIDYMQLNDIALFLPGDDSIAEAYKNEIFVIEDFQILIASEISKTCLDIWVE